MNELKERPQRERFIKPDFCVLESETVDEYGRPGIYTVPSNWAVDKAPIKGEVFHHWWPSTGI